MKTQLPLLFIFLLFWGHMRAQTTENFETETIGSATFTDNGQQFQITSTAPANFDVYHFAGGGWSGTGVDNRFIDNSGSTFFNLPVQFAISTVGGTPFMLKSMYLCLAKSDVTLIVIGSVTITGRLAGDEVFSVTTNGPYNTAWTTQNGFTFFDMATLGGVNNSNAVIDSFSITTTGNIAYVALDAMTWECGTPAITQVSQTNVSCNGGANGSATVSASPGVTYNWTPGNPAGDGTATVTGLTAGTWTCTVTTACGLSSSTSFTIEEPEAILINTQPVSVMAVYGDTVNFTISATNAESYQWQVSSNGTDWDAITEGGTEPSYAGTATSTLTVSGVTTALDGYAFRVVLSNDGDCETVSGSATLLVRDGLLAVDDDFSAVPITEGQGGIAGDVTANDLFNGENVDDEAIAITLVDNGGLAGATINEEGELAIPTTATEGTYTLTYTICELANTDNCSDATITVVIQPDLSVQELKVMEIKLYPNPARTEVFVQIPNDSDMNDTVMRIYDVSGRRLLEQAVSKPLHRMDMASFPAGIYLFDIASPSGKVTRKIIKH
jgi:hypothetical protein